MRDFDKRIECDYLERKKFSELKIYKGYLDTNKFCQIHKQIEEETQR